MRSAMIYIFSINGLYIFIIMATHEVLIEQVNKLFEYYDGNKNGYIENQEKKRMMHDLALELRVRKNTTEE